VKQRYSPSHTHTSALQGDGRSRPRPGRLNPGKETQYPLYRRLGGPKGRAGRLWKTSPPVGIETRTDQPVSSRYTNYAMPAAVMEILLHIYAATDFRLRTHSQISSTTSKLSSVAALPTLRRHIVLRTLNSVR